MFRSIVKTACAALVGIAMLSQPVMATSKTSSSPSKGPSAVEMGADLLVARPVQMVATATGLVVFVASLPFTFLGENVGQAGKTLVAEPAKATFVRCLGCKK
ncbi:MAG TPA: multidrug transporter [Gammaproteobacteria bacterium]|nr:multidrug transporter [Gammaproteobacteria bacterium]